LKILRIYGVVMKGVLGFENHRIRCIIGIGEEERSREQDILIDLKVTADFSRSAVSDQLTDTIDYLALAHLCSDLAHKNKYQLLEKFAGDVMKELFSRFPISEAWIKIKKPKGIETADFSLVELTKIKGK
jgi:dihydroneopterin aldolase